MQEKTNLLSYEDAAVRLGVAAITVKRMAADGKIPVIRFSRKLVRIPESSLESALSLMTTGGPFPGQETV
ncbi:hypothetical protein FACS1894142_6190 [Spirochaetia bacterium]|nr:hypothetical protein FACS1894142_6190 [Spirochaetia bacterium]